MFNAKYNKMYTHKEPGPPVVAAEPNGIRRDNYWDTQSRGTPGLGLLHN